MLDLRLPPSPASASSAAAPPAAAPPASSAATAAKPLDTFRPVEGGEESVSASGVLIAAYLLMWGVVFGFVFLAFRRQLTLGKRLDDLEGAIARAEAKLPAPDEAFHDGMGDDEAGAAAEGNAAP